jgi:hypothetical protein
LIRCKNTPEVYPKIEMKNRIDRRGDESLYQPKIHSDRIKTLYGLKQETGKPMTVLLDQAIHDLAERYTAERELQEAPVLEKVEPETWEEICEVPGLLDQVDYLSCLEELAQFKSNEQGRKTY